VTSERRERRWAFPSRMEYTELVGLAPPLVIPFIKTKQKTWHINSKNEINVMPPFLPNLYKTYLYLQKHNSLKSCVYVLVLFSCLSLLFQSFLSLPLSPSYYCSVLLLFLSVACSLFITLPLSNQESHLFSLPPSPCRPVLVEVLILLLFCSLSY
jgi:hypothetical protein